MGFRFPRLRLPAIVLVLGGFSAFGSSGTHSTEPKSQTALVAGGERFIENKGQWDARAVFLANVKGGNLWITRDGMVFDFRQVRLSAGSAMGEKGKPTMVAVKGHVVRMSFVDSQPTAVSGSGLLSGKYNYFVGKDPKGWTTGARSYSEAVAEQPYDGVSVRYSIERGTPRYDVIVKPGADPSRVGIKIEGADDVSVLPDGNLQLKTSLGSIEERALTAYQDSPNGRVQVPCRMVMSGTVAHFDLGAYDSSKSLVIDPLVYSTFFGAESGTAWVYKIALDATNNIYVAGTDYQGYFPTSVGAYESETVNGGSFVAKMNPTESAVDYCTFLAGSAPEEGGSAVTTAESLAVDPTGEVYVVGSTSDSTFPTTKGAFQTKNPGGFVTKISSTGDELLYSTFLAGSDVSATTIKDVKVNSAGDALVGGWTGSASFPVTAGAFQTVRKTSAPYASGFVSELNSTGTGLLFSTLLDGTGAGDSVNGVALDSHGNPVVCGYTTSSNFPVTSGAFQTTYKEAHGGPTGFLTRLNSTGSALLYSTFLGGTGNGDAYVGDVIEAITLDMQDNPVVVGQTLSRDFPVTIGAYQTSFGQSADYPVFVSKMNVAETGFYYSTFIDGSNGSAVYLNYALGVALDKSGDAIVVGYTAQSDFPTTTGAVQTVNQETSIGAASGFVSELDPTGTSLLYGTFLGGPGGNSDFYDECTSLAINSAGNVVIGGTTPSAGFPTTSGTIQPVNLAGRGIAGPNMSGYVTTLSLTADGGTTIAGLSFAPDTVVGGCTVSGTVSLSGATSQATEVTLTAVGLALQPPTLTIPAGSTTATFKVGTYEVNAPQQIEISASAGSASLSRRLTLVPKILSTLAFTPNPVTTGYKCVGTIRLTSKAPTGGLPVFLAGTNTYNGQPIVPQVLVVPAGSTSATFPVNYGYASTPETVPVSASAEGQTISADLAEKPPIITSFTFSPNPIVGGSPVTGALAVSEGNSYSGSFILLKSNTSVVSVPQYVNFPTSSTTFSTTTKSVSSTVIATITAQFEGASVGRALTVVPISLSSLSVNPASVTGSAGSTGTVYLNGETSAALTIELSSNSSAASVPATATAAARASAASFKVTTKSIASTTVVTLAAKLGNVTKYASLTVVPAVLSSLTLFPPSVSGGRSSTGTIELVKPAGEGGVLVSLTSSSSYATLPASVTVPKGATSATFAVKTTSPNETVAATIMAAYDGDVVEATLTITKTLPPG